MLLVLELEINVPSSKSKADNHVYEYDYKFDEIPNGDTKCCWLLLTAADWMLSAVNREVAATAR